MYMYCTCSYSWLVCKLHPLNVSETFLRYSYSQNVSAETNTLSLSGYFTETHCITSYDFAVTAHSTTQRFKIIIKLEFLNAFLETYPKQFLHSLIHSIHRQPISFLNYSTKHKRCQTVL